MSEACHGLWRMSLKTATLRVVISHTARANGHRQEAGSTGDPRPRSGFRSRVWACGRAGIPGRPRNVASQPAPETSATAAGTLSFEPLPREGFFNSRRCQCFHLVAGSAADFENELGDRGGEDQHQQRNEHEARSPPHGVTTFTVWPARSLSVSAAERRSSASVQSP